MVDESRGLVLVPKDRPGMWLQVGFFVVPLESVEHPGWSEFNAVSAFSLRDMDDTVQQTVGIRESLEGFSGGKG